MHTNITVAVGLSGGVDSSLAAYLLKEQGYTVVGLTMKIWKGAYKIQEEYKHACFGPGEEEDIATCQRLCDQLSIPYHVIDVADEYEHYVIDYFKKEYLSGRTPNPCIVCNREVKFGFLIEKARATGIYFDFFATGHYARTAYIDGIHYLKTARDTAKDQSYFLYGLNSDRLSRILFPLGEMTKEETRLAARAFGLETAEKPESQDFVGGGDYAPLFETDAPKPGDMVDTQGNILGTHRGLPFYTIGQRRGLGISISTEPLYVLALDAPNNRVIVGSGAGLFSSGLISYNFRLQNLSLFKIPFTGNVKIRQNHKPVKASIMVSNEGKARIRFEIPQRAVAPGQSAVVYSDEGLVLGGGTIDCAITDLTNEIQELDL